MQRRNLEIAAACGDPDAVLALAKLRAAERLGAEGAPSPAAVPGSPAPTTSAPHRSPVSHSLDLVEQEDRTRLANGQPRMAPKEAQAWLRAHRPGAAMFTTEGLRRRRNRKAITGS